MNGEESPSKPWRRRAKGYGEFPHPYQEAPCGIAGSFTPQGGEERWLVSLVDPEVSSPVVEII